MSPTVSNSQASSNPDYQPATETISGQEFQLMKLVDSTPLSTTPIGTAANPLHVQGTAVGGDVNIAEVGGAAVSLGQKTEANSIPVTLATTQDTADTDTVPGSTLGTFTKVGVPWYETGGPSEGWKPWPVVGDGQLASKPIVAIYGVDPSSGVPYAVPVSTSNPGSGDALVGTRSAIYGIDGVTLRAAKVDSSGVLAVQDNGSSLTVDGTVAATQSGTWSTRTQDGVGNAIASATTTPGASDRGLVVRNLPSGTQAISASSLPLPTGAATSALQSVVQQQDGVTGEWCNRVMGYDIDAAAFYPIPTAGFGTYIPVANSTGTFGAGIANTGNLTGAAQTVILNTLSGYSEGIIAITGTYSQTFAFEVLVGATWYSLPCWRIDGTAAAESSSGALVNTSRLWRFNCAGTDTIRVRCSTYVSGTAAVAIQMVSLGAHTSQTLLPTGATTIANSQSVSIASDQDVEVVGNIAHDAADSGNPVKVGARARTSNITAVANDDRVDAIADRFGRRVVQPYTLDENVWHALNASDITNTTSTSIKAATASTRYCITAISVCNMHASVSTRVDILDGSTRIWTGAATALGGGYCVTFPTPLPLTSNTAINAQCATTGAAVRVAIAGFSIAA